jgi:hypothetical protein
MNHLARKQVKAIVISPLDGSTVLWNKEFTISFSEIENLKTYPRAASTDHGEIH